MGEMDLLRVTVVKASLKSSKKEKRLGTLTFKVAPTNTRRSETTSVPDGYLKGSKSININQSFLFSMPGGGSRDKTSKSGSHTKTSW